VDSSEKSSDGDELPTVTKNEFAIASYYCLKIEFLQKKSALAKAPMATKPAKNPMTTKSATGKGMKTIFYEDSSDEDELPKVMIIYFIYHELKMI
jgi:hypothetical protein